MTPPLRCRSASAPLVLSLLAACGVPTSPPASSPGPARAPRAAPPAPTDPRGGGGEERREREREAWIEGMHRAGPGVDWRAVERANQDAERRRRNALRAAGQGAPGAAGGPPAWEEVGSSNQAGHTRCAALGPERGGARWLYVGSANGGLWRSPRDGSDWRPLSDALFGGVDGVLALAPANLADEDVLLLQRGASLLRSDDAGLTWTVPSGLGAVSNVRRMLVLADAQQTVLLLTQAALGKFGQDKTALYASTDLGQSFQLRWQAGGNWRGDAWTPRFGAGAGSDVYLLQLGSLRRSTDGGVTFTTLGTVDGGASEGSLQGSEAGAPTLYAVVRVGDEWRLHRSLDGGASFALRSVLAGYWGAVSSLAAFSTDDDAVFYGGVEGWHSFNGGLSFGKVNGWGEYYGDPENKLHADLRGLSAIPDPDALGLVDLLYVHTDGGTYRSLDLGQTVKNLSLEGLGVGQFYSTHTSSRQPFLVLGGTQDQGYQRGWRLPWDGAGPSSPFDQLISGDYGHLSSSDGDHDFVYCTYPGFVLIQIGEDQPALASEDFPAGSSHLWLPPVVADPLDQETFFFLADHLWRYDHAGGGWTPALHSNRDFGNGQGSFLSALAFAPTDPQRVYAANDAGRLWHSSDHGVHWQEAADTGPGGHYFYGNALDVHPTDALRAAVGGSGYSGPAVKETVDGGVTWQALATGLPSTLVYDLVWAPDASGDLYAATEAGAWRYDRALGVWTNLMGLEAPATTYWSVEAVPETATIRFGTYGRGIWDYRYGDPQTELLFLDGFESGDYLAGGWTTRNERAKVRPKAARSGAFGARLKKFTAIERAVSTVGYTTVRLEYSRRTTNYAAGDDLLVQWWDGAQWQLVEGTADTAWADVAFTLPPGAGHNPAFTLRFRSRSHAQGARADVDDVRLYGQP